jgi:hypothetical protein
MKLHHLDDNGNKPFIKKFFFGLYNDNSGFSASLAEQQSKDISTSSDPTGINPDELQSNQNPTTNSPENKLIRLFDRVGRPHLHDFTNGNICVFGDDAGEVESCSVQLSSRFASIGHKVEVIDTAEVSPEILSNSETPLLIKVSKQIPLKLMKEIIQACRTICVLKLKSSEIVCGLKSSFKSSLYTRELIGSLEGDCALRELLIASLANDEFLLIENTTIDQQGCESVRCFQRIIKQSDELF